MAVLGIGAGGTGAETTGLAALALSVCGLTAWVVAAAGRGALAISAATGSAGFCGGFSTDFSTGLWGALAAIAPVTSDGRSGGTTLNSALSFFRRSSTAASAAPVCGRPRVS